MAKQPNESTPNPSPKRHNAQLWLFPECAADAHNEAKRGEGVQHEKTFPTPTAAATSVHKSVQRQRVLFPEVFENDDADAA